MPVLAVLVLCVVVFILGNFFLVELFLFWDVGSMIHRDIEMWPFFQKLHATMATTAQPTMLGPIASVR